VSDKPSGFVRAFLEGRLRAEFVWRSTLQFTGTWDSVLWLSRPRVSAFKTRGSGWPRKVELQSRINCYCVKHDAPSESPRRVATQHSTMAVNYTFLAIQQVIPIWCHCVPCRIFRVVCDLGEIRVYFSLFFSYFVASPSLCSLLAPFITSLSPLPFPSFFISQTISKFRFCSRFAQFIHYLCNANGQ
jgi:hypothetical protein